MEINIFLSLFTFEPSLAEKNVVVFSMRTLQIFPSQKVDSNLNGTLLLAIIAIIFFWRFEMMKKCLKNI